MTIHDPAIDPVAELKANTRVPFEQARAMPTSVYTSEAFLEAELEHVFRKEWFCVGRATSLANPGDYTTMDLAGQPIIVVRGQDGALRAQSNVCLHRMSTLLHGEGNAPRITCPYHGWTYGLDGCLRGAPAMMHNEGFARGDYRLPQVRCEEWLGWVMVTLNPDAPSPASRLSGVQDIVGDFEMENYIESFREVHHWNTNWKVLAENFMESYHLPVCHGATIGGFTNLAEMTCPPSDPAFNHHWIMKDPDFAISVAHPDNTKLVGDRRNMTFLLSIYPSLMITLTPGYFWYLSLHPQGPDHVRIIYGGGLSPDFAADPDAQKHFETVKTLLDEVNEEDKGCTERVFRGLSSGLSDPGPLSHLERPNYDFATWISERVG
jgi:phenylpropionate dioxygenase-like ring-hydroxylating dioxygenase large terminal subunit